MIYSLCGDDSFALRERLRQLVYEFTAQHGQLAVERFEADEQDQEQILEAVFAMSLFSKDKLVVINKAASDKELIEQILQKNENISESTTVILVDEKFDKRAKYYKLLQKQTTFEIFEASKNTDLSGWMIDFAQKEGGSLNRADANYLVERVGSDKLLLSSEITKLVTYNPKITRETIELLCEETPQSTIFQLVDAAFSGNNQKAAKLYKDQRKQRVEPLAILGMIAWQLQVLATIKLAGERSTEEIAKTAKLNPFVVRKSQAVARHLSIRQLKSLVDEALTLDVKLKTKSMDPDESMQHFLLSLSRT